MSVWVYGRAAGGVGGGGGRQGRSINAGAARFNRRTASAEGARGGGVYLITKREQAWCQEWVTNSLCFMRSRGSVHPTAGHLIDDPLRQLAFVLLFCILVAWLCKLKKKTSMCLARSTGDNKCVLYCL